MDPHLPNLDDVRLETHCPWCGRRNDAHWGTDRPRLPEPDYVGICWGCGRVFLFEQHGATRRPTPDEQREIDEDRELQRLLRIRLDHDDPIEAVREARSQQGGS